MNLYEYIHQAKRTALPSTTDLDLFHSVCGLLTESGEVIDVFKRVFFYKTELSLPDLKKELGDITWYFNLPLFQLFSEDEALQTVCDIIEEGVVDSELHQALSGLVKSEKESPEFPNIWALCSGLSAAALKTNQAYWSFLKALAKQDSSPDNIAGMLQDIVMSLSMVLSHVKAIGEIYDMTLSEIFETNINKLRVRMPEKFDFDKVVNRDLDAEDKVQ